MEINFRKYLPEDKILLSKMVKGLYWEDGEDTISDEKIENTINEFLKYPEKGSTLMIEKDSKIVGYSILANFWSNEYGGNVLHIDELYILPEFRNQGIGSKFMEHLIKNKFNNSVAVELEVTPTNPKAYDLYIKIGFKPSKNRHLIYDLKE